MADNPTRWEYPHDIGFVHFFHTQNYQLAGEWFERAVSRQSEFLVRHLCQARQA